jgi:hypothetical protein
MTTLVFEISNSLHREIWSLWAPQFLICFRWAAFAVFARSHHPNPHLQTKDARVSTLHPSRSLISSQGTEKAVS